MSKVLSKSQLQKTSVLLVAAGMIALSLPSKSLATVYNLDGSHADVGFSVTHLMISTVKGSFDKKEASFDFDEKKNMVSNIVAKIDMASINTREPKRDEHLKSPDFFDTKTFPSMEFKSSDKVAVKLNKETKIKGNLTLHGVTKPVDLKVTFKGSATDPWGNQRIGFKATGKINREDFGVKWNKSLDKGGVVVSKDVEILIEGEAVAQKVAGAEKAADKKDDKKEETKK